MGSIRVKAVQSVLRPHEANKEHNGSWILGQDSFTCKHEGCCTDLDYLSKARVLRQLAEHALFRQVQAPVNVLQRLLGSSCSRVVLMPQLVLLILLASALQVPAAAEP